MSENVSQSATSLLERIKDGVMKDNRLKLYPEDIYHGSNNPLHNCDEGVFLYVAFSEPIVELNESSVALMNHVIDDVVRSVKVLDDEALRAFPLKLSEGDKRYGRWLNLSVLEAREKLGIINYGSYVKSVVLKYADQQDDQQLPVGKTLGKATAFGVVPLSYSALFDALSPSSSYQESIFRGIRLFVYPSEAYLIDALVHKTSQHIEQNDKLYCVRLKTYNRQRSLLSRIFG